MSKNRTGLYLGLAVAGAGGYYLYRAGGDVKGAKQEMKIDADKAREKLPRGKNAEKFGESVGKEAGSNIDEAIDNARSKAKLDERIPALIDNGKQQLEDGRKHLEDGKKQLDGFRKEARDQFNATVDKVDRTVEEKAAEAKGTVSGWFGGGKK
ncbi:uncharacterized protein N7473_007306 [Penicillium subrubescens]|uniref:Uncharacterized protein n=1 Tax=Penicillium subrubescens TaxID=1316194 RepID=A0A1Q5UMZ0_9EURO|nr:uncharacterized protein N7473_007306 [Penicillium subrubescens]KAJ5891078.1 hypothetical protein N7473_007306 [Penicillium subrubescens]OKP13814.1 hypothetical protein PENSUB_389 [Penicillium subrubescens]